MGPVPWYLLPDTSKINSQGNLEIGGCDTLEISREFGTPVFIYDEDHLRARCREAVDAFGANAMYASKAFLCKAMAKLAYEEGMGIDVATGGEMFVALEAGVPAERLVFHGNNKSMFELEMARTKGVGRIVVDSFDELERLETLYAKDAVVPKILLRITPGIRAETHEYIATGHDDSKFGFNVANGTAAQAVEKATASSSVELVGIHAHIGSQVFRVDSFGEAVKALVKFSNDLDIEELVVGGGLGVAYVEGEEAPTISQWAKVIKDAAQAAGIKTSLGIEPGRSIVAAASVTLYSVGTIKEIPDVRTYVSVDGGMSDNPRPILYGSGYEALLAHEPAAERPKDVRVVGKHCESGDLIIREAKVPADIKTGDILATPVTGGYGLALGSNYNKVLRPPVVFVKDGNARLVVRRESFEDLVANDLG